ncbi:MAG: L-seryl-tRNA(Sec) selenium transferase [Acidobacteria bacterium]|nr:L-seryl-tRNA(Sec) selenium transferase [Acidobacteriota bacterium]
MLSLLFCKQVLRREKNIPKPRVKPFRQRQAVPTASDSLEERLRRIPAVEEILHWPALQALEAGVGRKFLTQAIRETLAELREQIRDGGPREDAQFAESSLEARIREAVKRGLAYSLQPVINATGVVLHTNLGRAPLAREALEHAAEVACQYSNLEFDLATGVRGRRDVHASRLLRELLGAEAALVVNNNAAAVLIALNTLAEGGEVIVSRGELIEIGGSFRIPEIMQKSGAILREVGTTNRTRISDYASAIGEKTKLLLRVHPSNFRIVGFTERPALSVIVELGHRSGIPVFEDLGSGCLTPMAEWGIRDEPPAAESIAAGVDLVSFSGDKMLGGPQAGILAGRKDRVDRVRRNPLFRALRVDKLTYAVLETTLQAYLVSQHGRIPSLRMLQLSRQEIAHRAQRMLEACSGARGGPLQLELVDGESVVGGGAAPGQTLPTRLIALRHAHRSTAALEKQLLQGEPPVVARVEADTLLLDLRTVFPEQDTELARAILSLASG